MNLAPSDMLIMKNKKMKDEIYRIETKVKKENEVRKDIIKKEKLPKIEI